MGAFDGQTITDTSSKIHHDILDPSTMHFGNLGLAGGVINSPTPFGSQYASLKGTDIKLVHGDRWQEIEGEMTEDIATGVTTTIGPFKSDGAVSLVDKSKPGWWVMQLAGDEAISILGNLNESVTGNATYTYTGTYTQTDVLAATYTFKSDHNLSVSKTGWIWNDTSTQGYNFKYQHCNLQTQTNLATIQGNIVAAQVVGATASVGGYTGSFFLDNMGAAVFAQKYGALKSKTIPMEINVEIVELQQEITVNGGVVVAMNSICM